jgi:hypothetical protein
MQESRLLNPISESPLSVVITDRRDGGKLIVDKPSFVDCQTASAKEEVQQRCPRHETSHCSRKRPLASNRKAVRFLEEPTAAASHDSNGKLLDEGLQYCDSAIATIPEADDGACDLTDTPLWFSQEEVSQILHENKRSIVRAKKHSPDVLHRIVSLFQACGGDEFSVANWVQSHGSGGQAPPDDDHHSRALFFDSISRAKLRGLEYCLDKTMVECRSLHVRSLVKIQKRLPKSADAAAHDRLIRRRSLHTSRPARNFAWILAHIDSMEVVSML